MTREDARDAPRPMLDATNNLAPPLVSPHASPSRDGYMVQLDALRAIAVIGVCLHHWSTGDAIGRLPLDAWRVQLFFALSGFLITMILLKARARGEAAGVGSAQAIRSFYARRILRTWPLFFIVLTLAAVLDLHPSRRDFFWNATFLTNVHIAARGELVGICTHFWSLAVEEQFYLVWPWLILFVPTRRLTATLVGVAIALNVAHAALCATFGKRIGLDYLPTACVDSLVYGSILAIHRHRPEIDRIARIAGLYVGLPVAIAVYFAARAKLFGPYATIVERLTLAPVVGWILLCCARGVRGPVGRALEFKPLLWIGSLSYGIYLIHNFPLTFFRDHFNVPIVRKLLGHDEVTRLTFLFAVTIALAWIAHVTIERPLRKLRRVVPYTPPVDRSAACADLVSTTTAVA